MDSFGVRFNENNYIKVDIDFESGENEVTIDTVQEGTPITITGEIVFGGEGD